MFDLGAGGSSGEESESDSDSDSDDDENAPEGGESSVFVGIGVRFRRFRGYYSVRSRNFLRRGGGYGRHSGRRSELGRAEDRVLPWGYGRPREKAIIVVLAKTMGVKITAETNRRRTTSSPGGERGCSI